MKQTLENLISAREIDQRLTELALELNKDYEGKTVSLICILKGGIMTLADISRKLTFDVEFDFMDISSYGDRMESSGIIKINKDLDTSVTGKHILLVEDIIDTGRTLVYVVEHLRMKRPESVKVLTLLSKPSRRIKGGITPDYVGFEIPDAFVVGYGLDYAQRYRNMPGIAALSMETPES
ncbi:MAG: hypoxanthine phosphoribosyltransferase [Clostridiales bacterium]|nr:hypoxanthine phosphoribosyltransferase [Clostridiales bacterium]